MLVTDARAADHPIVWANDAFLRLTGYTFDEIRGRNCRFLQGPGTDRAAVDRIRDAIAAGEALTIDLINYRKDGTPFRNTLTLTPVRDDGGISHFFSAQMETQPLPKPEVTAEEVERQVAARTMDLREALDRKTALIHEIDHRAKNNLQVISSLMLLKARRTPEGDVRVALEAMAERVGALSAAHRLSSTDGEGTEFQLGEVVGEILSDLRAPLSDERVRLVAGIDAISLPAAMAAPMSLIVYELTANALRHAFPQGRGGTVSITARRTLEGMLLSVEDDGVGLEATEPNPAGFGRALVEMVVRQLRGRIARAGEGTGTRIGIEIPLTA